MFHLGSGAVAWASKGQEIVTLSSTEAEYIAATSAAYQAVWMRRLLADMGVPQNSETIIHCDNQSAIAIAKNQAISRHRERYCL